MGDNPKQIRRRRLRDRRAPPSAPELPRRREERVLHHEVRAELGAGGPGGTCGE
ncbi:MAG: hypothetical protein QM820_58190 [Minicystis sp.]